jgi:CRP/FNR family cyclic AMP-dependent transcriptional regulator
MSVELDGDRLELFRSVFGCSADVSRSIAAPARERSFAPRTIMLRMDGPRREILVVLMGSARVLSSTADGRVVQLYDLTAGDLVGLAEVGDDAAGEVVAVSQLDAAAYAIGDFMRLAETHAAVGLALSRTLLRHLQRVTARMLARSTLSATGRVYAELDRLGTGAGARGTIRPAPVLTALAERALTTRETASRAVAALERRGIVRRTSEELVILSLRQLRDLIV